MTAHSAGSATATKPLADLRRRPSVVTRVASSDTAKATYRASRAANRSRSAHAGRSRGVSDQRLAPNAASDSTRSCGRDSRPARQSWHPSSSGTSPLHHRVSPDDLRSFARFDVATVTATGCDSGHPALVRAVLGCGASNYVAPEGGPFGYASFFAPVFLFYELTEQRSLAEAVRRLSGHDL